MNEQQQPEGNAIVYCQGCFNTTYGKTAHGLVRFTKRYKILGVIDDRYAGGDAGDVLDGRNSGIPIFGSLALGLQAVANEGQRLTHFIIGLAPDGGRLDAAGRIAVQEALENGLNVDAGLHDFLSDDLELAGLAKKKAVQIRDIRKPPQRSALHFFSGKIESVTALKIAILGTDSAVGKRTTAWLLVNALNAGGREAELVGTGQTAWLQGARYSIVLDSLVNDFVSGEIEHTVWSAWNDKRPEVIVIEGQGSLMNPAYPGGFEILAAGRPDIVILQHAPARKEYDGFQGYAIHPLDKQIQTIELLSAKPVVAITVNHEDLMPDGVRKACAAITSETGLPAFDILGDGAQGLISVIAPYLDNK
ncbi:MAG: DUF1611 domain-containing protein [Desulfobacteraceae bacterium]|jgi:uncharacterized NAD-dependent epimerase/dehydratase family protein